MSRAQHRIGRLVFELDTSTSPACSGLDGLLRQRFDTAILPVIEAVLERIDQPGQLLRFERIELDLGSLSAEELAGDALPQQLARQLLAALQPLVEADGTPPPGSHPAPAGDGDELLAFLLTGELPWAEPGQALQLLATNLLALDEQAIGQLAIRLRPLLLRSTVCQRLLRQLPALLVRSLLQALLPASMAQLLHASFNSLTAQPASRSQPVSEALVPALTLLLRRLASDQSPDASELFALYSLLDSHHSLPPPLLQAALSQLGTAPPSAGSEPSPLVSGQPRPLHAAGAVLLHPYLPLFFERLGLLAAPGRFHDEAARQRGILLAHHLATGAEEAPEPETPLFKLLCGLPLTASLPRRLELSSAEREEALGLLRSLIGHWGRLGNTSPDGLREGFLTRPGRLERHGAQWLLQVERSAIDILLDDLPWTLSRVRTPFMDSLLCVDWR